MRRLRVTWPALLVLCGCASVPREAILREQELRRTDSAVLKRASRSYCRKRRAEALLAMARIQSPAYRPALAARLRDWSPRTRGLAVFGLGQLGLAQGPEGVEEPAGVAQARAQAAADVRPLLKARAVGLRAAAYEALGKTGSPEDEAALAQGLRDRHPQARGQAALALFRLRFLGRIPEYSSGTVRALRVAFSDPDPEVRWRAVYAFSRFAEPRAADALAAAAAEDSDPRARLFACRGLGLLKKAAPWEELVGALGDGDPLVRTEAVKALGLAGRADRLPGAVFADPSPHVRAAAADALAATGEARLADKLDLIAAADSPLVKGQALLAAAALLPPKTAAARLAAARADAHWWVRSRAYLAAADLPGERAALLAGLKDPDTRVASAALEALAKTGGDQADAAVEAALLDPDASLEMAGAAADAAAQRKLPRFLGALAAAYERPLARAYPELSDSLAKASRDTAAAFPEHKAKAIAPRALPPIEPSSAIAAAPPSGAVVLETAKGEIELELATHEAPLHVAAFLESARKGLYDGTIWHRVVSGFVVQGGDPRGSGWGDAGFSLRDEINRLAFTRGALGMPKAGKDTGGCQLFITHVDTPHLDGRYTVFGRVRRGMDVVDRLEPGDRIIRARLVP